MADQISGHLGNLFADGGDLLRRSAQQVPTEEVLTLAVDGAFVEVREDSFQVQAIKGDQFEIHGVFVDGAQIWNHPEALAEAEANVTSIYASEPGKTRLLRPLFNRDLSVQYSLRNDVANNGIRTRVKIDTDGTILDYETDVVRVRVNPMTFRKCGKLIVSRTHGRVVTDAAVAAMQYFGFENAELLYKQDGESSTQAYERIATLAQNTFANLINATFALDAGTAGKPWIYKATKPPIVDPTTGLLPKTAFYTQDQVPHKHVDGLYCKISPAFRELVALITQSLARFYLAGGLPEDVNTDALEQLIQRINTGYDNAEMTRAALEVQLLRAA